MRTARIVIDEKEILGQWGIVCFLGIGIGQAVEGLEF